MHLRMPSIDRGVQSFIWAVVFFLFLYLGMLAIAISKSTALILALVAGFVVFLLVRTRGDDDPRDRRVGAAAHPDAAQRYGYSARLESSFCVSSGPSASSSRTFAGARRLADGPARGSRAGYGGRGHECPRGSIRRLIHVPGDRPTRSAGRSLPGVNASSPIRAPAVSRRRSPSGARREGHPGCGARPLEDVRDDAHLASEWNGTSTCGCVTRLIDVEPQAGQRTATATVPRTGASNRNADGVTGRGAFPR